MSKVNTKAIKKYFGFLNFVLFVEFMVHLIHRKRVPLLHNTEMILCDEGDGLVAVKELVLVLSVKCQMPNKQRKKNNLTLFVVNTPEYITSLSLLMSL